MSDDKELVDALCDIDEGLTEWEVDFVESIAKVVANGTSLTVRQLRKADSILARFDD